MDNKKKKTLFGIIMAAATIILIGVGSTFAYFSASVTSENSITASAAEFELDLKDDVSLIKSRLIPSEERFVDIATNEKRYKDGAFIGPYKESEESTEEITKGTACIDDNLYEICSIYSFTITNPNLNNDLPLYITLDQSINTFENLYFKVLDSELNTVIEATQLIDSRYKTYEYTNPETNVKSIKYEKDEDGISWIKKDNFDELKIESYVLTNLNKDLPRTTDETNPSKVTYHIVLWINETHDDQTEVDSGKVFAAKVTAATGPEGTGITGVFTATGTE